VLRQGGTSAVHTPVQQGGREGTGGGGSASVAADVLRCAVQQLQAWAHFSRAYACAAAASGDFNVQCQLVGCAVLAQTGLVKQHYAAALRQGGSSAVHAPVQQGGRKGKVTTAVHEELRM
jgi:hypothetical protein